MSFYINFIIIEANGSAITCCKEDGSAPLPPELRHFGCFPIEISPQDSFFKQFQQGCMNFVRTQLAPNHDCSLGYAKQVKKITYIVDIVKTF